MKIRKAKKEDIPGLLELNEGAVPHVNSIDAELMEWFLMHAGIFEVVEFEEEMAGFLVVLGPGLDYSSTNYHFFNNNYTSFDYVDRIVIAEKYRRKKLGSELYQHLFNKSAAALVTCEVNLSPPNPNSFAFHERMGFKEIARQRTEGGKEVSLMLKRL